MLKMIWAMWTSQFLAKVPNGDLFSFTGNHAVHLTSQGASQDPIVIGYNGDHHPGPISF